MGWPKEYGGGGARPMEQAIVADEMAKANAPAPTNSLGLGIVGPTIVVHGTDAQKTRYLRKILSAEELWCQLYSEPNAGSDLAALKTSAVDAGDHFVVNGQKIWTSGGAIADWGLLLARTDTKVAKHKGISCFLMSMRQPGVDVRPLKQITGSSEFCEVFMTNARVEKSDQMGKLGEGWAIAQTTLGYERGGRALARITNYSSQFTRLVEAAKRLRRHGRPLIEDPVVRQKLGRIWSEIEVERYQALRTLTLLERGEHPGAARLADQALVLRVREALHGARPRDPRPLRPADPGRPRGLQAPDRHRGGRQRQLGLCVSVVARGHHLRRLLGDPEERDRRAHPRPAQGNPRGPGGRQGVNFSFSDDQILLKNSVRAALDEQCKPAHVRAMFDDPRGYGEALWSEMAKLGWLGLPFPEEQGGAGLGLVELGLVLEEMGRAAYPGPFFATVVLGGLGHMLGGNAAQKDKWLSAIAAGKARATAALLEEHLDWDPASTATRRRKRATGGRCPGSSASCRGPTWPTWCSSPRARPKASPSSSWIRSRRASRCRPWSASTSPTAGRRCVSTRSR